MHLYFLIMYLQCNMQIPQIRFLFLLKLSFDCFLFNRWSRKGFSYYRISKSVVPSHPGLKCTEYIDSEKIKQQNPQKSVITDDVSKCPPSLSQTTDSFKIFTIGGIPSTMTCYAKRSALSSTARDQRTQRCCYDKGTRGLILDSTLANGFNTYMLVYLCKYSEDTESKIKYIKQVFSAGVQFLQMEQTFMHTHTHTQTHTHTYTYICIIVTMQSQKLETKNIICHHLWINSQKYPFSTV
jgi:hypothetical protein